MPNSNEVELDPEQDRGTAKTVRTRRELSRAARLSVYIATVWVWVELPWELLADSTEGPIVAVLVSK